MHLLTYPRLLTLGALALVLVVVAKADAVAAGIALVGLGAVVTVLRHRSRARTRWAVACLLVGVTLVAVLAAVALPTYNSRPSPLIMTTRGATDRASAPASAPPAPSTGTGFTALGFVASDYDDSGAGVDQDVSKLSTLAATGIVLASSPGSIKVTPATDALVRAHAAGATGLVVVSNFDGTDFNPDRAMRVLGSPRARHRFLSAVVGQVARRGWDGVVLDFEQLPPSARSVYPELVHGLVLALGARLVLVAVPASDHLDLDLEGYDLAALGREASRVVLMAYDQHELSDPPGPVAGMAWVRASLSAAEAAIPRQKLLLGIPGYGYAWSAPGVASEVTARQAAVLASQPGATSRWDEAEQEWRVDTTDGRELWYEDARSFAARAQLAFADGLGGFALWRVGSEDPKALDQMPVPTHTRAVRLERAVQQTTASGVVALTFDDGPDPTWTPRVLSILHREHAPATFFVIGTQAQAHPGLVREEMRFGDVVANHTYSHHDLSKMPTWRARMDIAANEAVVEGITGRKPYLFRAPFGAGDMSRRGLGGDQIASDLGLHPVNWNDDPDDWLLPPPEVLARRVVDGATERSVVLLHDGGGNRANTVAALPAIIEELRTRGYLFTTIDGLDASIPAPYLARHGPFSTARGLLVIAVFRLQWAGRRVVVWLLLAIACLSLLRLLVAAPLALVHGRRRHPPGPVPDLSFSVVIAARNEAAVIDKTLAALGPAMAEGVEVIVVDDGSTDATADIARAGGARVLRQPKAGKARALNAAIATSHGDIVVVVDADTVVDAGFFAATAVHFADARVGAVAGNIKVGNRNGVLARVQALEYVVSLNLDRRAQAVLNVMAVVPGAASAVRRAALDELRGYSTDTLVEDADLTVALLRAGWRIPYEPRAVAWTEAPERVTDVLRQRRRWAYGTVEVVAKHAGAMLDPAAGRVGLIGLPWMLVSQVALPIGGPLTDAFLCYLILSGAVGVALAILGVATLIDVVVCAVTVAAEREDLRLLPLVPLLRLIWRPLQLLAVGRSLRRWANGTSDDWRKVERYGSVPTALSLARSLHSA